MSALTTTSQLQTRTSSRRRGAVSSNVVAVITLLTDAVVLLAVGFIVYFAYTNGNNDSWAVEKYPVYALVITVNLLATVVLFYLAGLYSSRSITHPKTQFLKIFTICQMLFLLLLLLAFAAKISAEFSRGWAFWWCLCNPFALYFARRTLGKILVTNSMTDMLTRNIAIVGSGEQGVRAATFVNDNSDDPCINIVGFFDDRQTRTEHQRTTIPFCGNLDALIAAVRADQIDDILIALPWSAETRILEITKRFQALPVAVRLSTDIVGVHFRDRSFTHYAGLPALNVSEKPLSSLDIIAKNVFDFCAAIVLWIIFLPVGLVIAVLVKLDSPGSIFFRQKRIGYNNRLINVYKFRTMHTDQQDDDASKLTTRNDPRVTRLGRILRMTSLDELPQLINVIRGEMSLVGPRPHPLLAKAAGELYENVVAEYSIRHKVKPGITGWAQINGWRGETDTEEKIRRRVECDLHYIDNWSLLTDFKILLMTVPAVLTGRGAF